MALRVLMWSGTGLAAAAALAWVASLAPGELAVGSGAGAARLVDGVLYWPGVLLPLWVPLMLGAFVGWAGWRLGHEGRERARVGRCLRCGYDLAGLAGRCPECGGAQPPR